MQVVLAQIKSVVGDVSGNLLRIKSFLQTVSSDTDLVIFPELFLTGYPPKDLLSHSWFRHQIVNAQKFLERFSRAHPSLCFLIGTPTLHNNSFGKGLYNSARLFYGGQCVFEQHKKFLPDYDVFEENRHFDSSEKQTVFAFKGEFLGISICEDIWSVPLEHKKNPCYNNSTVDNLLSQNMSLLINISASPFERDKHYRRQQLLCHHAQKTRVPCLLVNQVGANDSLIFDGNSFAVNTQGCVQLLSKSFAEDQKSISIEELRNEKVSIDLCKKDSLEKTLDNLHDALILGIKSYLEICGIKKVILGISGGIDSALTAVLACSSIGSSNVLGVFMPSPYSSEDSLSDAKNLAKQLQIDLKIIPITPHFKEFQNTFSKHFDKKIDPHSEDTTEENIQARIRSNILMAFANRDNRLLLTCGNKSEIAVGYCTLYGDMSGGLCVLGDLTKTWVYKLAGHLNKKILRIPQTILSKEPTAELKPNQKDSDTLPEYSVLDPILEAYIEKNFSISDIVSQGFSQSTVEWIIKKINQNEHKRRQMCPILKVSSSCFSDGRRFPIAASYHCFEEVSCLS